MRLRAVLIIMCLAIGLIPIGIFTAMMDIQIATAYLGMIFLVTLFLSFFIAYFISAPLERLTRTIDEISKGNLDTALQKSEIDEINTLTNSLNRVLASLKLAIHKVGVQKGEIFEETIKAKQEVETKYQDLLRTLNDWIWEVDDTYTFTFCSPQISKALGYTTQEILGKKLTDILKHQEIRNIKKQIKQATKNPERIYHFDIPWLHKNGYTVPTHWSFIPIIDDSNQFQGLRGNARDQTELTTANEKINRLQQQLEEYQEKPQHPTYPEQFNYYETLKHTETTYQEKELYDFTLIFDEHTKIIDCDTAIADKLGYKKEELIGQPLTTFNYLETSATINEKIQICKQHGHYESKTIYKTKKGTSMFVSEHITYLTETNLYKCCIIEDKITLSNN